MRGWETCSFTLVLAHAVLRRQVSRCTPEQGLLALHRELILRKSRLREALKLDVPGRASAQHSLRTAASPVGSREGNQGNVHFAAESNH